MNMQYFVFLIYFSLKSIRGITISISDLVKFIILSFCSSGGGTKEQMSQYLTLLKQDKLILEFKGLRQIIYRKSYPFYHLYFSLDKSMYEYCFGDHLMIVDKIMSRDCIFFSEY